MIGLTFVLYERHTFPRPRVFAPDGDILPQGDESASQKTASSSGSRKSSKAVASKKKSNPTSKPGSRSASRQGGGKSLSRSASEAESVVSEGVSSVLSEANVTKGEHALFCCYSLLTFKDTVVEVEPVMSLHFLVLWCSSY